MPIEQAWIIKCDCGDRRTIVTNNSLMAIDIVQSQYGFHRISEDTFQCQRCFENAEDQKKYVNIDPKLLDYVYEEESVAYKKLKEAFGEYDQVGTWGLKYIFQSCYNVHTSQYALSLLVPKKTKDIDRIEREISLMIPILKPYKDGYKHISIFEHTCAEHGSWSIEYKRKTWYLTKHYFQHPTRTKFESLRKLIEHISINHWHGD